MSSMPEPQTIFISYSRNDIKWLELLSKHLKPYLYNAKMDVWDDRRIHAGDHWQAKVQEALGQAAVAVLLVTPDFLASDFISSRELPQILEAARDRGLIILWIAVEASAVSETPIASYQALNDPKMPLVGRHYAHRDQELSQICLQIRERWLHCKSSKEESAAGHAHEKGRCHPAGPMLRQAAPVPPAVADAGIPDTSAQSGAPFTGLKISGLERSQLTKHYTEQAESASTIDIITLTMQAILENYGNERLLRWISLGKKIRILILSPFSMAAKIRSREEYGNESFLPEKVITQVQILGRLFELARQRVTSRQTFLGSLEVRFYDGIPYCAYFGTEYSMTLGLYYSHMNGLQSEAILFERDSTIYRNMGAHFQSIWDRGQTQGSEDICVITQERLFFVDPGELKERFRQLRAAFSLPPSLTSR